MGIKGSVMDLGQRETIGNDRLTKPFIAIGDDVCGIQQERLRQS